MYAVAEFCEPCFRKYLSLQRGCLDLARSPYISYISAGAPSRVRQYYLGLRDGAKAPIVGCSISSMAAGLPGLEMFLMRLSSHMTFLPASRAL